MERSLDRDDQENDPQALLQLLMAHGVNRNTAQGLARCINVARRYDFIDGFTIKFVNGQKYQVDNVHSYREAYESTQKDGVPLV